MPGSDPATSGRISPFEAIKHADEDGAGVSGFRHYVYTLAYPNGRVFYVGKGIGQRILEHETEARRGVKSEKCDIIRDIWAKGGEVVKRNVGLFASDEEALKYEHHLISSLDGLVNVSRGSGDFSEVAVSPEDQRMFGASIRRFTEDGQAYWSAREMASFLGYSSWTSFKKLIEKVERAFAQTGLDNSADFKHITFPVFVGQDARREIEDVHLSGIGFLLVLQNADSTKAMVAYGKSYVARQALGGDIRPLRQSSESDGSGAAWEGQPRLSHRPRQKLRQIGQTTKLGLDVSGSNRQPPSQEQHVRQSERQSELAKVRLREFEDRLGLFAQLMAPEGGDIEPSEDEGD